MENKCVKYDGSGCISSVICSDDVGFDDYYPDANEGGGVMYLVEGTDIFNVSSLEIHSKYRVNVESKSIERISE